MTQLITNQPRNKLELMREVAASRSYELRIEELVKPYDRSENAVLDIGVDGDIYPGGHLYMFRHAIYETMDKEEELRPSYVADIRDPWMPDRMFTVVLFVATLEHIVEGRDIAIKQAYRITDKLLIIVAPLVITDNEKAYAEPVTLAEIKKALPRVTLHSEVFDDGKTLLVYINKSRK